MRRTSKTLISMECFIKDDVTQRPFLLRCGQVSSGGILFLGDVSQVEICRRRWYFDLVYGSLGFDVQFEGGRLFLVAVCCLSSLQFSSMQSFCKYLGSFGDG
ncbi:hypothetical protein Bca52824_067395 [Brassica carinata]|uniref:Uncharacterized protein n=1 Tax=Brassica carinata TaxID=52824 RepID=A0A8X7QLW1_BRACI|nr:hypothetical protein Bca52824_067395 [Brassica carinata]